MSAKKEARVVAVERDRQCVQSLLGKKGYTLPIYRSLLTKARAEAAAWQEAIGADGTKLSVADLEKALWAAGILEKHAPTTKSGVTFLAPAACLFSAGQYIYALCRSVETMEMLKHDEKAVYKKHVH